ncbi:HXXEE domain-containing protein [Pseudobacteriovorax antillogorgiicola]|uniref:DNA-binding protein n=1 Tax=Pseudobacteriovorax antillogorgiicola TaxID=1513793 RepID=A0A1Y6CWZ5_9BACT|nr:HXXEE domain-containing protein [Pseudobacteriovorax antillogorgiicola]TCS41568.1 DNA-binding protein [Pseudobacteriovorax antillogorgiicola]SMF83348.1 DNA-binding protein [Pseudobacteriovorax antillogorgiicola]
MTQAELIQDIADATGMTKTDVKKVFDSYKEIGYAHMKKLKTDADFALPGFGNILYVMYRERFSECLALILFFGSLWLPMGQIDFLVEHWMKLGFYLIPFLFLIAWKDSSHKPRFRSLYFWTGMLLISYIFHQIEEHWIDIYGNRYAFSASMNELLKGITDSSDNLLSHEGIFVINTTLVWLVGGGALVAMHYSVFPALCMAAIVLINAIAHIGLAVASWEYNPGTLTSIMLFLPVSLLFYKNYFLQKGEKLFLLYLSLGWSILCHVVMVVGTIAVHHWGVISESLYFLALFLLSIVPLLASSPAVKS